MPEEPIDLGGGDFLPPLPGGLAPTNQPVTFYFMATFEIAQGRNRANCYATIRVDGYTDSDIYSIALDAQLQARALEESGDSCGQGVLVNLELTSPTYYQYSGGML